MSPTEVRAQALKEFREEKFRAAVEAQDVAAMLEKIRQMQAPEQARIRAKERLAASRQGCVVGEVPRQAFHAQILSIGDYRKAA